MSTAIISACFVVALIAMIGLVLVLRNEPRITQTTNEERNTTRTAAQAELLQTDSPPAPTETPHAYPLKGQFHEVAVELHILWEQSQEMEQRLSVLTMMIEKVERSQNEQASSSSTTAQ